MGFDIEAAKKAGYSDKEIEDFVSKNGIKSEGAPARAEPPPPTTVIPTIDNTKSTVGMLAPAAGEVVKLGAEYALPAAGAYGLWKGGQAISLGKSAVEAFNAKTAIAEEANRIARMNAERLATRPGFFGTGYAPSPATAPVAPTAAPVAPTAAPVAPTAAPAAAATEATGAGASWLGRTLAAVEPYIGTAARMAGGVGMALYPSPLGKGEQEMLKELRAREAYHREIERGSKE